MSVLLAIAKSCANLAGSRAVNIILTFTGSNRRIGIRQVKYLNNILKQDHRFIKRITRLMMGFKAFHFAAATLVGIELTHMIRKNQFANENHSPLDVFAERTA